MKEIQANVAEALARTGNPFEVLGRMYSDEAVRGNTAAFSAGATSHLVGREDFVAIECFAGGPQVLARD